MNIETIDDAVAAIAPPIHAGVPQSQGDLIILPWAADVAPERRAADTGMCRPIPAAGVTVLTGNGGHEHRLSPVPGATWYGYPRGTQTLGVLNVEEGAAGVLGHIEHGDTYIGPGVYVIRRQREQADEIRLVQD
jgi:hypothetical protein